MNRSLWFCVVTFILLHLSCANSRPQVGLDCKIPAAYIKTDSKYPPTGQSEAIRYRIAYEAFWWNCVAVKSIDLDARVPFVCNGTPAAVAGSTDGTKDALRQIDGLLKRYSESEVKEYLKSIASTEEAVKKMKPYFNKPRSEKDGM